VLTKPVLLRHILTSVVVPAVDQKRGEVKERASEAASSRDAAMDLVLDSSAPDGASLDAPGLFALPGDPQISGNGHAASQAEEAPADSERRERGTIYEEAPSANGHADPAIYDERGPESATSSAGLGATLEIEEPILLSQPGSQDTGEAASGGQVLRPVEAVKADGRPRVGPRLALISSDVAAICLSEIIGLLLVHGISHVTGETRLLANLLLSLPLPIVTIAALAANGLYVRWPHQLLNSSFSELRDIIYSLAVTGCLVLGIVHLLGHMARGHTLIPLTVVVTLLLGAALIPAGRGVTRVFLRAASIEQFRVIIVGSGVMASHVAHYLSWDKRVTLVGYVDDDPVAGHEVLGGIDDLAGICEEYQIDQVVVGFSRTHPARALERLRSLNGKIAISIVPRYFELLSPRSTVKELAGLPLVDLAPASLSPVARLVKRCFDLAIASGILLLLSPALIAAAIVIRLTSPGPAIFRQQRVGKDGRTFVMYKFRTMSMEANDAASRLRLVNEMDGPLFKMKNDPRVTRVGGLLRRTSLDELPQLFNVLKGDMSLVGPRPFVPSESAQIDGHARRRFEVRPGMTGLWQISGRSQLSYSELARLDYLYVASWSLWWDMRILWHTPARVLEGRGAF
jgi:exopolysaccharide biosynthesis polyprenyl glycosylphosphotransferase